jgi:poly(A) polymerase Pap1
MFDAARREEIRSRVTAARKGVVARQLRDLYSSKYASEKLRSLLSDIEEVETMWLEDTRESRTPEAEATWLGHAEAALRVALLRLEALDELTAAYGPSLTAI